MPCPPAAPMSEPMPPLPALPQRGDADLPLCGGWFLSSYELKLGVTVVELEPGDEALT